MIITPANCNNILNIVLPCKVKAFNLQYGSCFVDFKLMFCAVARRQKFSLKWTFFSTKKVMRSARTKEMQWRCFLQKYHICRSVKQLKSCVGYFLLHHLIAVKKLRKMLFISSKKLSSFSKYSSFCISLFLSFFSCQPLLKKMITDETLHKKWSFPLRIFSVNVTKSPVLCGFGHIYWRNP